jgi:hypothetical protein
MMVLAMRPALGRAVVVLDAVPAVVAARRAVAVLVRVAAVPAAAVAVVVDVVAVVALAVAVLLAALAGFVEQIADGDELEATEEDHFGGCGCVWMSVWAGRGLKRGGGSDGRLGGGCWHLFRSRIWKGEISVLGLAAVKGAKVGRKGRIRRQKMTGRR